MASNSIPQQRITTFTRTYIPCAPGVRPGRTVMDKKTITRQAFGMAPIYHSVKIVGTV